MDETTYDADTGHEARPLRFAPGLPAAPMPAYLPDLYQPKRRRVPLLVVTGLGFMSATGLFYGAEALLPPAYKPSIFIGGYTSEIERARKAGELASQVRYEAQLRGVEIQYQTQLKTVETSAIQIQEQCRANLQNMGELYKAVWNRAGMYAQATADIQKQYAATRYQTTQQTLGGQVQAANTATMFGYFAQFFSPELAQKSFDFAEGARQDALSKLDAAAKSGITVSVEGWNTNLPDPTSLSPLRACDPPSLSGTVIQTAVPAPTITVPELPAVQPPMGG